MSFGVERLLGAAAGVDDDERVDEAIAVVVVRLVVDDRIGLHRRLAGHRPRVRRRIVGAGSAAAVGRERQRHAERPDHLAGDRDLVAAGFLEVLANAAVRQLAGREEQILEVLRRLGHQPVREVDEHDDHAHLAAQRRPLERAAARHAQGGIERQIHARLDQAVVVAAAIERHGPT